MGKLLEKYDKAEEYLLVGSLVVTVVVISIQVIMRYVFNASLSWSEELTRYIFIWQIWLGTSIGFREGKHIKVELLQSMLGPKGKINLEIVGSLIWIATNLFFIYNGTLLTADLLGKHAMSTALRIPLGLVYASLPVSCFMLVIRQLLHLRALVMGTSTAKEV